MTPAESFVQAILSDPDDDGLRFVYADWLEERGDPRGEFLRLQYLLAGMSRDDPDWHPLFRREIEMIRRHKEEWFGPLRKRFSFWECHRGFLDEVWTDNPTFLAVADELFARHPVQHLRGVDLTTLASSPHLARLTELNLAYRGLNGPSVQALAGYAQPLRLHTLELSNNELGDGGAALLAGCPQLSGLRTLRLRTNQVGSAGARALAQSPHLRALTTLDLSGNTIGPAAGRELKARFGKGVLLGRAKEGMRGHEPPPAA